MGAGIVRLEPGLGHGVGISRKHRSGDGVPARLRGLDVFAKSTHPRRFILCTQLPDQDCAIAFFSVLLFLLVIRETKPRLFDFGGRDDFGFMD